MSETRNYDAVVEITDAEALGMCLEQFVEGNVAFLPLHVLGVEVTDYTNSGPKSAFTGSKEPKLVPTLDSIVWRRTDQSKFSLNLNAQDPNNEQSITLTYGRVELNPLRIRGNKHPQFNRTFSKGIDLLVTNLSLVSDRSVDRAERIHRPTRLLPFIGKFPLISTEL